MPILGFLFRSLLSLRYRIRVTGLQTIAPSPGGMLFLPNHPALIDPVILFSILFPKFKLKTLADQDQFPPVFHRFVEKHLGMILLPDISKYGSQSRVEIEKSIQRCIEALQEGHSLLLYPSGHVYRHRWEDLRGNTALERILRAAPQTRIVLIRTQGLWGSSFSWASGQKPDFFINLKDKALKLLKNGIFFMPRRPVQIECMEKSLVSLLNLNVQAPSASLNKTLEDFYNKDAPPAFSVPYYWFQGSSPQPMAEPEKRTLTLNASHVSSHIRKQVLDHLQEKTGKKHIQDHMHLAQDLGLDSLSRTELGMWLEETFSLHGIGSGDSEALQTVGDVLLAATGESLKLHSAPITPPKSIWFSGTPAIELLSTQNIPLAFLKQAQKTRGSNFRRPLLADSRVGVKTFQEILTALYVLIPLIKKIPGNRVGIMLPASVTADLITLAALFAKKTPVFINWTVGVKQLAHSLQLAEVEKVLTAELLLNKLKSEGMDLTQGELEKYFIPLEPLAGSVSKITKIFALLKSFGSLNTLWKAAHSIASDETAAILFTSGSESLPKAVPLSHSHLLSNIQSVLHLIQLKPQDCMLGMLPPFHSFGLTITLIAPLCAGLRVVHHPNPMEADVLARLIGAYQVSLLLGTPTFLSGICRAASVSQMKSVRIAITGAEKCSERVYAALRATCPLALVTEGYGITECAPVVAFNPLENPKPFSIGKILPSLEFRIENDETHALTPPGDTGMLLVRGPSIFHGYLKGFGENPFVLREGKSWYRTGDLVRKDKDDYLFFMGRKKRFVKIGGEMISLPAIEEVLAKHFFKENPESPCHGPQLAVEALSEHDHPEIVLFTTLKDLERAQVNDALKESGFSGLYQIRRIITLESIPVLGTGKTDYRSLKTYFSK